METLTLEQKNLIRPGKLIIDAHQHQKATGTREKCPETICQKKKQQRKPESTRTTGQWTPMCETRFVESRLAAAATAAPDAERLTI